MKLVKLNPNRVYLTDFDRVTYSQIAWAKADIDRIKQDLIRKLKLLAITKGHVVIAASHLLESELAREIILPFPELITEQFIVPALRNDFDSCASFLEAKRECDDFGEGYLGSGLAI